MTATTVLPSTDLGGRTTTFLTLCCELTGYDEYDLRGTGQLAAHLDTVDRQVGAGYLDGLLGLRPVPDDRTVRTAVRGAITKLWYVGIWAALPDPVYAILNGLADGRLAPNITYIPSNEAYLNGLVWPAFGGHPMGGKPPGFGSWSTPPEVPA